MARYRRVEDLLQSYPRARPELPPKHRETYVEHYRENREGKSGLGSAVRRLESWMHRRVAEGSGAERVLELGAGTLNHVTYHPQSCVYDAVEPFRELWADSPNRKRINRIYADLSDVADHQRYDAIVSVAVMEHLTDLPWILARSGLLLAEKGSFCAGFPSEGGLLWGLAWRTTTGLAYRWKRGLDYGSLMRHEHVNDADEIVMLLRYFYRRIVLARFPAPFLHFSFYTVATAELPHIERCSSLIARRKRLCV